MKKAISVGRKKIAHFVQNIRVFAVRTNVHEACYSRISNLHQLKAFIFWTVLSNAGKSFIQMVNLSIMVCGLFIMDPIMLS